MKYKLNIQKFIENPKYEEDLNEFEKNRRYYGTDARPERFIGSTCLECELTEKEFTKFKAEIIKIYA